MLRRYSMWIGDTARNVAIDRSSNSPSGPRDGSTAWGAASTSAITRNQLRSYSARACSGMSEAG